MRCSRRAPALWVGGLLLAVGSALGGPRGPAPGALSRLGSGDLIILDSHLGLFRLKPGTGKVSTLVDGFGLYEGVDIEAAAFDGSEAIFVNQVPASRSFGARLVSFNLDGKPRGEWLLPPWKGRCSGLAIDVQAPAAYVATMKTAEIFKLDLRRPKTPPQPLARISEATVLGSLALDAKRQRLLVADVAQGALFAVDLGTRKWQRLARDLGEPSALALDAGADQLFVTDASGRRVWVLDLATRDPKPRVVAKLRELEEPMGLTLASDGSLWVGDPGAGKVFQISRDGRLLRTVGCRRMNPF